MKDTTLIEIIRKITKIENDIERLKTVEMGGGLVTGQDGLWRYDDENVSSEELTTLTTGDYNSVFGVGAGDALATGDGNVFIGLESGYSTEDGDYNTFVGFQAGYNNVDGFGNTAVGIGAGYGLTEGQYNTIIGYYGGYGGILSGDYNCLFGYAGYNLSSGGYNIFIGHEAGDYNTIASNNIEIGYQAGLTNEEGEDNVFIGYRAGHGSASNDPENNVIIGSLAGYSNEGDGNVFIGYNAGYSETGSNKLYIDNSNTATPLIYGDFSADELTINGHLEVTEQIAITSSALLGTPEAGTIEFYNDRFYITDVATARSIDRTSDVALSSVACVDTTDLTTMWTGTIAADALKVGNVLKVEAYGQISSDSPSDVLTLSFYIGSTQIATVDSPGKAFDAECWSVKFVSTVRSVGGSGVLARNLIMTIEDNSTEVCGTTSIDTTGASDITIKAQWNSADPGNTFGLGMAWLEYKN